METYFQWKTNRKWHVAYQMAPVLMTLNGHSPVADLFKCNLSNICAAFYQISTDIVLAWFLSDSWAFCFLSSSIHNQMQTTLMETCCTFCIEKLYLVVAVRCIGIQVCCILFAGMPLLAEILLML